MTKTFREGTINRSYSDLCSINSVKIFKKFGSIYNVKSILPPNVAISW